MSPAKCHRIVLGPEEEMSVEYPGDVIDVLVSAVPYNAIEYKIRGNVVHYKNRLKIPVEGWVCVYYH